MSKVNEELARFQAQLLNTLDNHTKANDILNSLSCNPATTPYKDWLEQMSPSMVEVGAELVKKWGRK